MSRPRSLDDLWDDEPAVTPAAEMTVTVTTEVRRTIVAKMPVYDAFVDEDPFVDEDEAAGLHGSTEVAPGLERSRPAPAQSDSGSRVGDGRLRQQPGTTLVETARPGTASAAYDPFVEEEVAGLHGSTKVAPGLERSRPAPAQFDEGLGVGEGRLRQQPETTSIEARPGTASPAYDPFVEEDVAGLHGSTKVAPGLGRSRPAPAQFDAGLGVGEGRLCQQPGTTLVQTARPGTASAAYDPFVDEDPFADDDDVAVTLYDTVPPEESFEEPVAAGPPALTVSQLTQHITQLLRSDVLLTDIWVRGEICNLSRPHSGHVYFSLKDESACVACVMWSRDASRLPFRPESGMQVLAHGRIETYAQRGIYQIICQELQPDGLGSLYLSLEQSKARLAAEGLLDAARKRPLPRYPRRVAVVTSLCGAAVRDVCVILRRDAHPVDIVLIPAQMQGSGAEAAILAGLDRANRKTEADLIIIARGGGSVEDLWTFNSETLARAIGASRLPVISAVGHETDFTLADFVADMRAPTPTAAAEMVAALRADVHRRCERAQQRIVALVSNAVRTGHLRLEHLCSRPVLRRPERLLDPHRQRLDEATARLQRSREAILMQRRNRLGLAAGRLEALSPLATLSRGYGLVTRAEDSARVTSLADVAVDDAVRVRLTDGHFEARVTHLTPNGEGEDG